MVKQWQISFKSLSFRIFIPDYIICEMDNAGECRIECDAVTAGLPPPYYLGGFWCNITVLRSK
jgi:hypothetical protein